MSPTWPEFTWLTTWGGGRTVRPVTAESLANGREREQIAERREQSAESRE